MAILINENTRVLVQGITGKQGSVATKEMLRYGTNIVCGVTPGKGGHTVENVLVYNNVREACAQHHPNASVIYAPPFYAKSAVFEAIDAGIPLVVIITEGIPLHDTAKIISYARAKGTRLIGPSSVGIIVPKKVKIGSVGGFDRAFSEGSIGLISKSGGMTSETALLLTQAGLGQSTALSIGGDVLLGSTFADILLLFENDPQTKAVVLYGEIGGTYEEEVADCINAKKFTKPLVAYISGVFAGQLPSVPLGHAGAIIEGEKGTREQKVKYLKSVGVAIADVHHDIVKLILDRL